VQTFHRDNEKFFWEWLGDNYISTEEISSGGEILIVELKIKTIDGIETLKEGDVLIQRQETGEFYICNPEEFDENYTKLEGDA